MSHLGNLVSKLFGKVELKLLDLEDLGLTALLGKELLYLALLLFTHFQHNLLEATGDLLLVLLLGDSLASHPRMLV